jgi:hypothetical protein
MGKERCFMEAGVISQPVGLVGPVNRTSLVEYNEGTELLLPVYESVHRSQRRGGAGWGWAASFAVASSVCKPETDIRSYYQEQISANPSSRALYQASTWC